MFIASKQDYDEFCSWAFPILEKFEEVVTEDNRMIPRLVGFVSEYLANLFFVSKYDESKIARFGVVNIETTPPNALKSIFQIMTCYHFSNSNKNLVELKKALKVIRGK